MVTGNGFQTLIDLKRSYLQFYKYDKKALMERDPLNEFEEIEEGFRTVKWSSKFIEIKFFRIL